MKKILYFIQVAFISSVIISCQTEKQEENNTTPQSFRSNARVSQVGQGEFDIIQNGKVVGGLYVPQWATPTDYKEYWVLSKDYVYLNSAPYTGLELVPMVKGYDDIQTYRTAMKAKFGSGKFITVDCHEENIIIKNTPWE